MSGPGAPNPPSVPAVAARRVPHLPEPDALAARTRDFAAHLYDAVAKEYLDFRRRYYHETDPVLGTPPPGDAGILRTETAAMAQRALKFMPREAHAVPLVRDLLDHLQWVVDIHTVSERERTNLHNATLVFLHGIEGGIQPWYVAWLSEAGHQLQSATDQRYFLAYPWQGLLYVSPDELERFDTAIERGDVTGIEREVERLGNGFIEVLRDPLAAQPKLVFSGPNGEHNRAIFNLKTSAALALGAYLAADQLSALVHPHQTRPPLASLIPPLPQPVVQHLTAEAE